MKRERKRLPMGKRKGGLDNLNINRSTKQDINKQEGQAKKRKLWKERFSRTRGRDI